MIKFILLVIKLTSLYFLLPVVTIFLIKDLICYIKYLKYYKHQGIEYKYFPLIGFPMMLISSELSKDRKDGLAGIKKQLKPMQDADAKNNSTDIRK